jgi:hypothetical protein
VHTVTAGTRLGDIVPMLEADPRIQVVFTHPESALIAAGTRQFLGRLDGVVLPWRQATQIRFGLALTASDGLPEWVRAPVVSMLHGVGYAKYPVRWDGNGPKVPRTAAGPERVRLVSYGRLISSALLLPTEDQVSRLLRSCPEAAPIAVVAGDPCYDRLAPVLAAAAGLRHSACRSLPRKSPGHRGTAGRSGHVGHRQCIYSCTYNRVPASRRRDRVHGHRDRNTRH